MTNWRSEMGMLLRVLLDDYVEPFKTSDKTINRLLVVAAQFVIAELNFDIKYSADVNALSITPDPTNSAGGSHGGNGDGSGSGTRDENFINLTCVRAACIADMGAARTAARQSFIIKEGTTSADLTSVSLARLKLLEVGFCKTYEDMKMEFRFSRNGTVAGAAIMTPFRLFAGYNDQLYGTMTGSRDRWIR